MKIKIFNIEEDISESEFPKYINEFGYSCKRIKSTNINKISKILGKELKFEKGIPDFFIWKDKEMYLCEFKSKKDSWRISQIYWAINHSSLPIAIAIVNTEDEIKEEVELEIDAEEFEVRKENKVRRYIQDLYFNEYADNHPKEIGINFLEHYDKKGERFFLGSVPIEVGLKWDLIDKTLFKDKQSVENLIFLYEEGRLKSTKDIDVLL